MAKVSDADLALIEQHGPSKLARLLNVSLQTVCNWKKRGIPAAMKLRHPELLLPNMQQRKATKAAA